MRKSILALTVLASLLSGCAGISFAGRGVPMGALFVDSGTNEQISDQQGNNFMKTGEACAKSILGWVVIGQADVKTAAEDGGISDVAVVDNRYKNILGLYAEYCVIVHGTGSDKAK